MTKQIRSEDELAALPVGTAVVWEWTDTDAAGLVDQKHYDGTWSKSAVSARRSYWWNDPHLTCHVVYAPADFENERSAVAEMVSRTAKIAVLAAQVGYPAPSVFQTEDGGVRLYWPNLDMLTIDIALDGEVYAHLVFGKEALEMTIPSDRNDFAELFLWLSAHEEVWGTR